MMKGCLARASKGVIPIDRALRLLQAYFGSFDVFGLRRLELEVAESRVDPDAAATLTDRVTDLYWLRVRTTGLGPEQGKVARDELRTGVADCLRHFEEAAPEDVEGLTRTLGRYDRLRAEAGIDRHLLEEPSRLLPGAFGLAQAIVEVALGAIPAATGLLLGGVPLFVARAYARRVFGSAPDGLERATHVRMIGGLLFVLFWGGLIALAAWRFSTQATVLLTVLFVPSGLFALTYLARVRSIVAHVGGRTASWFTLADVARVREAQDEVIGELDRLRNRYRQEAHGWPALPPGAARRTTRGAVGRVALIAVAATGVALFARAFLDQPIEGLPLGPSPWQITRATDPAAAERELLRDANGVLLAAQQLDHMESDMAGLYGEFLQGDRDLLTQEDHDAMRAVLVAYLDLRSTLLKTVWLYRGDNADPGATVGDPLERRAFLTAYTAAVLLVEKAWLIHDTFRDDPTSRAQLDRADAAWGIPAGTYTEISGSLTNVSVMAELQAGVQRFESDLAAGHFPGSDPWGALALRAQRSRPSVDATLAGIGRRRLERAWTDMVAQLRSPAGELTPAISMAVSRFRFKERPPHRGLISPEQLNELRPDLRPGDILIERRNWYISNSLLPGFWPHAALYLGSYDELAELGVVVDERAAPHMADYQAQDEMGHDFAVIEAIGEGVVFTSLEHSVGEADAVAILRPNLTDAEMREALSRALSHRGKGYDFDFDFQTTDRLVCTELIFRTYDGILQLPEMRSIMGQPRLAAVDYVGMWANELGASEPQLGLVTFLDFDEANQRAVEADAATLVETLDRSRFTFAR
jgi:hypothetical protein